MDSAADIVRSFYERMEARDWAGAGDLLATDVHIDYTETGEGAVASAVASPAAMRTLAEPSSNSTPSTTP